MLKKLLMNRSAIFFMCFCFVSLFAQDSKTLFDRANQHYSKENYRSAEEAYQNILKKGEHSAALYFNLGNTYYKLNKVAEAIYYYELALRLSPQNKEIKTNLSIVQAQLEDRIKPLKPSQIMRLWNLFLGILTPFSWSIFSIICSMLSAIVFTCYLLFHAPKIKKLCFSLSIVFLLFLGISYYVTKYLYALDRIQQYAIVFSDEILVREEPISEANSIFQLHKGIKVQLGEKIHNWIKISLENGQNGWVNSAELREIQF